MSVKRFQRLLRIREIQENETANILAARLEELRQAERQRDQLLEFQRLYFASRLPTDARMLKLMAQMQMQLREALEQQEHRIAAAQTRMDEARAVWLERHQDSLSLEKVIERRRRVESGQEQRKQQHEQDMWSTRLAFQRIMNPE